MAWSVGSNYLHVGTFKISSPQIGNETKMGKHKEPVGYRHGVRWISAGGTGIETIIQVPL